VTILRLTPRGLLAAGRLLPCVVGRGGLTSEKREGDGATPRGRHRIADLLYRPDRIAPPAPWGRPVGLRDIWSDDPADPGYNAPGRAPSPHSHERLRRPDPLYDLILVTDWNLPAVPGRGSAIFLHRWRRRGWPTGGCIALAPADLLWLARRAPPGTPLLVP
jgi:L,D-peptidoglycan transpeptidase YkuD (ErfK/YbiS/YcfS/YnhG family)